MLSARASRLAWNWRSISDDPTEAGGRLADAVDGPAVGDENPTADSPSKIVEEATLELKRGSRKIVRSFAARRSFAFNVVGRLSVDASKGVNSIGKRVVATGEGKGTASFSWLACALAARSRLVRRSRRLQHTKIDTSSSIPNVPHSMPAMKEGRVDRGPDELEGTGVDVVGSSPFTKTVLLSATVLRIVLEELEVEVAEASGSGGSVSKPSSLPGEVVPTVVVLDEETGVRTALSLA